MNDSRLITAQSTLAFQAAFEKVPKFARALNNIYFTNLKQPILFHMELFKKRK